MAITLNKTQACNAVLNFSSCNRNPVFAIFCQAQVQTSQFWILLISSKSCQDLDVAKSQASPYRGAFPRQVKSEKRQARWQASKKSNGHNLLACLHWQARHTYGTVQHSRQTRPHSLDPHHTAICSAHTDHCYTQSQIQHKSSSLKGKRTGTFLIPDLSFSVGS